MKYSIVWCESVGKITSGAANLNGLRVLSHDDYAMGSGRKLIYVALVHLICNCVQAFRGVYGQLLSSPWLLSLALHLCCLLCPSPLLH
jgi:hypothetical protein